MINRQIGRGEEITAIATHLHTNVIHVALATKDRMVFLCSVDARNQVQVRWSLKHKHIVNGLNFDLKAKTLYISSILRGEM